MIQTFKKIIVYIVLFSFALTSLPQGVLAANVSNSGIYTDPAESKSTWVLNQATTAEAGAINQKTITHSITGTSGSTMVVKWNQDARGAYQKTKLKNAGLKGYYIYSLQSYSLGTTQSGAISNPYGTDIYLVTTPTALLGGGVPAPSSQYSVTGLYYKEQSSSETISETITLYSESNTNEAVYLYPVYSNQYSWANDSSLTSTLKPYLQDTSLYLRNNHPTLATGGLPAQYSNFCSSLVIEPDSSTNPAWQLVKALQDETSDFHKQVRAKMITAGATGDNVSTEDIALNQATSSNASVDKSLYKKFYSDMDRTNSNFYPNKIPNTGDSLDQQFATTVATIQSWTPDDFNAQILGTSLTMADVYKAVLGTEIVVGGPATAYGAGSVAVAKVGSAMAKKTAAKAAANGAKLAASAASASVEGTEIFAVTTGATTTTTAASAGTISASAATALSLATVMAIGTLAIIASMEGVAKYVKKKNKDFYNQVFQLTLASIYMTKQMEFSQCIMENVANKNIPADVAAAAGFTPETVANGAALAIDMARAATGANAAANDVNNLNEQAKADDACGNIMTTGIINWAFCEISQAIYYVVRAFVNWANSVALSVIGVTVSSR
ncbi:hypothetical protein COT78_03715 [Candidatus Berkelbacteria bacterium CG10_big_fil_rev_8_21_14_0_10_43_13]|uniref:Uncharacterized protein n=1 Tax=Candidatus Berkelbacteria bacterium CG10_big_fil_rev_8_21_14_0_10_43_13 TaxID=1974514 RepID=A0A2H0W5R0_9BACT|nr:MAG: hypothetical protein COT78_03715 [Candidatus Berkelbacteria bacterium CG10_big_fil_rev_8_21_14_0_10_43_13]